MLRTSKLLQSMDVNQEFYYKEYFNKTVNYTFDLENDIKEAVRPYQLITCITIPIKDIKLIVQVHGIDETGNIKYDLFGKVQSDIFSKDHVTLVELALYGGLVIVNINELYRTLDGNEKSFNCNNDHIMNVETIHKICNAILTRYLCRRFSELEKDGLHSLDYEDYLNYLEF